MDAVINSEKVQPEEQRKRLKKLKSVKVANLNKLRLKSRFSQAEESKQKQISTGKFRESSNYMKATSCYNARRVPLERKPGEISTGRKCAKGSAIISRTDGHEKDGAYQGKENRIKEAPVKTRLVRSGSFKLTRVKSRRLVTRRWSKSRLDQAWISMEDDEETDEQSSDVVMADSQANDTEDNSSHSTRQKTANSSLSAPGLKPIKTLWKMPSLRSRRRPVKKRSELTGLDGARLARATCSSALKSSKVPKVEEEAGVCDSEQHQIGHACPYHYCSLHSHSHDSLPTLKSFISNKRRSLKKQKSIRLKRKSKTENTCYENFSRTGGQVVPVDDDPLMFETETENSSVTEGTAHSETAQFDENQHQSSAEDSDVGSFSAPEKNIVLDNSKYANMWKLIYKHLPAVVPETKAANDGEVADSMVTEDTKDVNLNNQVSDGEKPKLEQAEAIEFVQQAVDEILRLDEQSTLHQPVKESENIQHGNDSFSEPRKGEQPQRQRSRGFEKLRKMIITAKFIKAVEKLRRIKPQSPQCPASETHSEFERVRLRHLSMDGRKNTDEWMLDFALRQVVRKLAPAQQKRVATLVEAFERVAPDSNVATSPTMIRWKERSIALDLDGSGSCDDSVEDPERRTNPDAYVASENGKDHKQKVIIDGAPIVQEVDGNKRQPDEALKQSITETVIGATASRSILELQGPECNESLHMISGSNKQLSQTISATDNDEKATDDDVHAKPTNATAEIVSSVELSRQSDARSASEENILFDREKFSNVWHMVYKCFVANEATVSGIQKVEVVEKKERDEVGKASSKVKSFDLSMGSFDNPRAAETGDCEVTENHELNQAHAVQLVQEAIDELLRLLEQLSDHKPTKPSKAAEQNTAKRSEEPCTSERANSDKETIDRLGEDHNMELKDMQKAEPDRTSGDEQTTLQRQTSKTPSRLKRLILSAKFIKAMEKLRKIAPHKTQNLSSPAGSEAENVNLRHSSPDGRRNSEEWMLDYALQQVINKLAPAQQRRVALLTRAFETLTPELQEMSTKLRAVKMQPGEYNAQATEQENKEEKPVVRDHGTTAAPENSAQKSDDPCDKDASATAEKIMQQAGIDKVQDTDSKLVLRDENHEHNKMELPVSDLLDEEGHPVCSSGVIQAESKKVAEFKCKLHVHCEQSLVDYRDEHPEANVPEYVQGDERNSKMWQLIYQHVKSSNATENEGQTDEAITREDQINGAAFQNEKLELTQSDAIKLVQEAVDGILQNDAVTGSDETNGDGNKQSSKTALQRYSKLRKAIICSKFVKAMEKMQKTYTRNKRCQLHLATCDQEAERVHLIQCLTDERNNSETWMLDYALQQVIAKLAPTQRKRVTMLVEAFETIGPDNEEPSKEPLCEEQISAQHDDTPKIGLSTSTSEDILTHPESTIVEEPSQSHSDGENTNNDGRKDSFSGEKRYSSMWSLIYRHIKSGVPGEESKKTLSEIDTYEANDAERLDEETLSDSHQSYADSTSSDVETQNPDAANSELQERDALELVQDAVNEILQMQEERCDDQPINAAEKKTRKEDETCQSTPRVKNALSKVILCKKFVKEIEKMKKRYPIEREYMPEEPDTSAESIRLRPRAMGEKKCDDWMLDYALRQVIGNLAPTQKKKVSMLVEAFERVNPLPEAGGGRRLNTAAR